MTGFFKLGYRPFFLGAAFWAAAAMALWVLQHSGHLEPPSRFASVDWHIHELLFGYVGAVIAGFLLTAVPNWTSRPPVAGVKLGVLFATWGIGRAAVAFSTAAPASVAMVLDLAFPCLLILVIANELITAGNHRNLKILILVALHAAANLWFHLEATGDGDTGMPIRLGFAAILLLIILIGGRVVPSFTRNWLASRDPGSRPTEFGKFDALSAGVAALALAVWVAAPDGFETVVGHLLLAAAVLHLLRLARWVGHRTTGEPLVLVLHVAYGFVPLGFLAAGAEMLGSDWAPAGLALHVWGAGAIGMMTMAIMTRASLGHAGAPLTADRPITAIYAVLCAGVVIRAAAYFQDDQAIWLQAAAACWIIAFLGFILRFARESS